MSKNRTIFIIFSIVIIFSSCNFPLLADSPAEEPDTLATAVAQTIQAMNIQPQATQTPPEQATAQPEQPTLPPQPTAAVSAQPTVATTPCNQARFIIETVPDDSEFDPDETFIKSWTFENTGTCSWGSDYKLIFFSGDAMDGPASVSMPGTVAPGAQITLEVTLKAPANPGTYTGTWKLQAQDNEQFGQVTVRIQTIDVAFSVTSVDHNLEDVSPGSCPYTYAVEISITASTAGKVTYTTETSDGAVSPLKSLTFDEAGTQIAELEWSGLGVAGTTTDYWLKVYIVQPNNQPFGPYNFKVTCP